MTTPRTGERDGWVYFIEAVGTGRIKIGWTAREDVQDRLTELSMQAPVPLRVVVAVRGPRRAEQWLHGRWGRLRVHGEWFVGIDAVVAHFVGGEP
jgi:hypothetical protein